MPNAHLSRCHASGRSTRSGMCSATHGAQGAGMTLWPSRSHPSRRGLRALGPPSPPAHQQHRSLLPVPPTSMPHRTVAASFPAWRGGVGGGRSEDEAEADAGAWSGGYGLSYDADQQTPGPAGRSSSLSALAANLPAIDDTNALQTALAAAITSEDFPLAAAVRDRLREVTTAAGLDGTAAGRIDWAATGMADWLADRVQRLGYRFPTEIQRRSAPVLLSGSDAVVGSETGSGKTLSFLLPLLARLTYPPDIFMDQMKGPQALVVVPTLELGVQVALLAFRLLGGNISSGRPGDEANMYTYFGPKGVKVRGVLNKEEVVMSKSSLTYLSQVHLVIGTPAGVMEAFREPEPAQLLQHLKVIAIDEVDECFTAFPGDMEQLMVTAADPAGQGNSFGQKPQVIFVGATQRQDVLQRAMTQGWLREPVSIQVGREGALPTALSHRYIVVPAARRLAALARSLRFDLAAADKDSAPARVMLFVNTPAEAAAVAEPLRSSLWSDHRMAVLVPPGTILGRDADSDEPPSTSFQPLSPMSSISGPPGSSSSSSGKGGEENPIAKATADVSSLMDDMFAYNPIRALHSFRDNTSSLLLATGAAARGLDLPAVTHVYSLGLPPDSTQYLHRAGRAGRIGSTAGGIVTTLVTPDEVAALLHMGQQLGIKLVQEEEAAGELLRLLAASEEGQEEGAEGADAEGGEQAATGDMERLRKGLEDVFNLM